MDLVTPRLVLREFRDGDFDAFYELETHPATYYYESHVPDAGEVRRYLEQAQAEVATHPRLRYRLAVTRSLAGGVRGRVTLTLLNESIREWEIGWALHPADWGQGLATEAARCLADFAFTRLRAHRLVAFCHAANSASAKVTARIGMQFEGQLRETRWWQGAWANEFVYALLERDWGQGRGVNPAASQGGSGRSDETHFAVP